MPRRDINEKPFDEGTRTKLEVFQLYVREWLPVFLAREKIAWPELHLFDFFCGSGTDAAGVSGSPLRILEELEKQPGWLARDDVNVTVHFSDEKPAKIQALEDEIERRGFRALNIGRSITAGEFSDTFAQAQPILRSPETACLVFLDQYGIKDVTEAVFKSLVQCPHTDFLFFISSAIFGRLGDHPSIRKYLDLGKQNSYDAHRAVVNHFRQWVPRGHDYYLAPFSIKKGANVYGLVFGSGHPLGMEKFLKVAWKLDPLIGEANFDIDREGLSKDQLSLFNERPTKVTAFEADLREGIASRALATEADVYRFCISSGFTPSHAEPVLKELKREALLEANWKVPRIESLKTPRPMSWRVGEHGGAEL